MVVTVAMPEAPRAIAHMSDMPQATQHTIRK